MFKRIKLTLLIALVISTFLIPTIATAAAEPRLDILVEFPKVEVTEGEAGQVEAVFTVEFLYLADLYSSSQTFELITTAPKGWTIYMTPDFPKDKNLLSLTMRAPSFEGPQERIIRLVAVPPVFPQPEAGEYNITLEIDGENIDRIVELIAVIPNTHYLEIIPTEDIYSFSTTAGADNYFSLDIINNGSATVSDIVFSADTPNNWIIDFSPKEIQVLNSDESQTVEVFIKPQASSIAGDYVIIITATGLQSSIQNAFRVSVAKSGAGGWIGVAITAIVFFGVFLVFRRFGRR